MVEDNLVQSAHELCVSENPPRFEGIRVVHVEEGLKKLFGIFDFKTLLHVREYLVSYIHFNRSKLVIDPHMLVNSLQYKQTRFLYRFILLLLLTVTTSTDTRTNISIISLNTAV